MFKFALITVKWDSRRDFLVGEVSYYFEGFGIAYRKFILRKEEAIVLLSDCIPLADLMAARGVNIKLTDASNLALAGFKLVLEDGWLDDPDIARQAGLSRRDIAGLTYMLNRYSQTYYRLE